MALHGYGFVRFGYGYGRLVFLYRVRFCTVLYGWVRLGTVGYAVGYGWVRLGTVEYGFVRFGTVLYSCTALYGCMGYVLYIRLKGTHVGTGMYRWGTGAYGSVWVFMGLCGTLLVCTGLYGYR